MLVAYGTANACNGDTVYPCACVCGISGLGFNSPHSTFSSVGDSLVMLDLSGYDIIVVYGEGTSGEDLY